MNTLRGALVSLPLVMSCSANTHHNHTEGEGERVEIITAALTPYCEAVESPASARYYNGFAMELAFGIPPNGKGGCTFPDGSSAHPYAHPDPDRYDLYVQLDTSETFYKFEVKINPKKNVSPRDVRGHWRVPVEDGVDMIVYVAREHFKLRLVPANRACTFSKPITYVPYKNLLANARVVYGGPRPGDGVYHYWDYSQLEPTDVDVGSNGQFHLTFITGFHNQFADCVNPTRTLTAARPE